MDCTLQPTGTTRGAEREYRCARCGQPWWHRLPPERLHRMCGSLLRTAAAVPPAKRPPCVHRGQETRREECDTCKGKTRVKVFACALHGECTIERPIDAAAVCAGCADWTVNRGREFPGPSGPIALAGPPHPNAGNWWHDEGRVVYRSAERVEGQEHLHSTLNARPSTLLLRFPHGIGDHLMFTVVLRHLRALRPDLRVDVQCKAACVPALSGLCRNVFAAESVERRAESQDVSAPGSSPLALRSYDLIYDVPFFESDAVHADLRTGKAGKCLWESFGILPRPELAAYQVTIDDEAQSRAAAWLKRVLAPRERTGGRRREHAPDLARDNTAGTLGDGDPPPVCVPRAHRFALVHYQGHTARSRKDLPALAVRSAIETIAAAGVVPVLLDWTGKSALRTHPAVVPLGNDPELWGRESGADIATLAALARRAALCVGIDSGPGHVFGAESRELRAESREQRAESREQRAESQEFSALRSSPLALVVWTKHHPVHFYGLSPHVTHLLPVDHERNIHGNPAVCREFFHRHYCHRTYTHLGRALGELCSELLTQHGTTGLTTEARRHGGIDD